MIEVIPGEQTSPGDGRRDLRARAPDRLPPGGRARGAGLRREPDPLRDPPRVPRPRRPRDHRPRGPRPERALGDRLQARRDRPDGAARHGRPRHLQRGRLVPEPGPLHLGRGLVDDPRPDRQGPARDEDRRRHLRLHARSRSTSCARSGRRSSSRCERRWRRSREGLAPRQRLDRHRAHAADVERPRPAGADPGLQRPDRARRRPLPDRHRDRPRAHEPRAARSSCPEQTEEQTIPAQLARCGFALGDVTTLVNSHLHIDHVGGNKLFDGHRRSTSCTRRSSRRRATTSRSSSSATRTSRGTTTGANFETVSGDVELAKGLWLFETPGHTVGHYSRARRARGGEADAVRDGRRPTRRPRSRRGSSRASTTTRSPAFARSHG